MSATKTTTVLDNNITLSAGAGDHTSSVWIITGGYGGEIFLKVTNGATGPTLPAQCQIWVSPDNSNWYKFGNALLATLGNNVVTPWSFPIPMSVKYLKVISGSNTDQDVTLRVEGTETTKV